MDNKIKLALKLCKSYVGGNCYDDIRRNNQRTNQTDFYFKN
jgi:hypothetical protein